MRTRGDEMLARDAVRALPEVRPDSEFRARLLRELASGSIPGGESAQVIPFEQDRRKRAARLVLLGAGLAAAATILIALGLERASRDRPWTIIGVTGQGTVFVNGERFSSESAQQRIVFDSPGKTLATEGEVVLDLQCADWLTLQVPPGTEIVLPAAPGRWLSRSSEGEIHQGELRLATGPSFHNTTLALRAPHAIVEISGTVLAVFAGADSTCVCVLEGSARMTTRDGRGENVPDGRRLTVFDDGRSPVAEDIFPMERMKLEMLRDRAIEKSPE